MLSHVYIAGPYTHGDRLENVKKAMEVADKLLSFGFSPFLPHLTHYWDEEYPHHYEDWMTFDFSWLARCDALIRLPGESPGADREVAFAKEHHIPVYEGLKQFLKGQGVAA